MPVIRLLDATAPTRSRRPRRCAARRSRPARRTVPGWATPRTVATAVVNDVDAAAATGVPGNVSREASTASTPSRTAGTLRARPGVGRWAVTGLLLGVGGPSSSRPDGPLLLRQVQQP